MANVREISYPSDITSDSLEQAILEFNILSGRKSPGIDSAVTLYLVTSIYSVRNAINAIDILEKYLVQLKITVLFRVVDFLDGDSWFLTSGKHLIFSPGASF